MMVFQEPHTMMGLIPYWLNLLVMLFIWLHMIDKRLLKYLLKTFDFWYLSSSLTIYFVTSVYQVCLFLKLHYYIK